METKLFKTRLCHLYQRGGCHRQYCSFAHGEAELRRFLHVANVDDLISIDVDEKEDTEQNPEDSERTLSVIPEGGEASGQQEDAERGIDSSNAAQGTLSTANPSDQNTISTVNPADLTVEEDTPGGHSIGLSAMPLRTVALRQKKRHRSNSSSSSASDSTFNFEDMSADDFADSCYRLGKALHKKTSNMAKDITALQQKVILLDEANAKIASLESSEAAARQEIEQLKASLAKVEGLVFTQEEQIKFRDEQLKKLNEEHQQHLATARKMKNDFDETVKRMEEAPAQNVVQRVITGYKAALETYEEIQIILAPALRRGYTLGVDEAKPADLMINTLPNHRLYDKKAGEVFTRRYDEYKSGEDIISKYAKKKSAQPATTAQPSAFTQPSASAQPSAFTQPSASAQPSATPSS